MSCCEALELVDSSEVRHLLQAIHHSEMKTKGNETMSIINYTCSIKTMAVCLVLVGFTSELLGDKPCTCGVEGLYKEKSSGRACIKLAAESWTSGGCKGRCDFTRRKFLDSVGFHMYNPSTSFFGDDADKQCEQWCNDPASPVCKGTVLD